MRRDFGPVNFSHVPPGGYPQLRQEALRSPAEMHYVSERNRPLSARLPARILFTEIVDSQIELPPDFQPTTELYNGNELGNPELPIHEYREEIKQAVKNNPITILTAETGSGKSTQVPQLMLEAGFNKVYLTQPRRIATYNIASRVQTELTEVLGDEGDGLVGMQTAQVSTVTDKSKIIVLTDGIEAVKALGDQQYPADEVHIIDEVHEWNTNMELTIARVKQELARNPDARFVITSATFEAHKLAAYFAEAVGALPPIIEVAGRNYEVDKREAPESTVVREALDCLKNQPGKDMLIFVAGVRQIEDTIDEIYKGIPRRLRKSVRLLPLHAKMTRQEQDRINSPFDGVTITVATNVAQTSLTIPGVDIVIDSGEENRVELDSESVEGLHRRPVSQADCIQRAGRTGRLAPGTYILTRYNDETEYVPFISRPDYGTPEILRSDIDRTTLRTARAELDLRTLPLFHKLKFTVIDRSEQALFELGALDENGKITEVGQQMDRYPVKPYLGRMMIESHRFPKEVQQYMAAMAAAIEVGGLPDYTYGAGTEWSKYIEDTSSDLLAQLDIFIAIQGKNNKQLQELDLDLQNVERAKELFRKISRLDGHESGNILPPKPDEREALLECIYAGMVSYLYRHEGRGMYIRAGEDKAVTQRELSNRSIVKGKPAYVVGEPYRVESYKDGALVPKHIIDRVTVVRDPVKLGRIAAHLVVERPEEFRWRNGRLVQQISRVIFGMPIGTIERKAVPSKESYEVVVTHALNNPGPAQRKLRDMKKRLEELQHLTLRHVPQITQDQLIALVREATPEDVLDPGIVDGRLREIMRSRKIRMNDIIPERDRDDILLNAPEQIQAGEIQLQLRYRQGRPIVRHFRPIDVVEYVPEDITEIKLDDGRDVVFVYDRKEYTLSELRRVLLGSSMYAEIV